MDVHLRGAHRVLPRPRARSRRRRPRRGPSARGHRSPSRPARRPRRAPPRSGARRRARRDRPRPGRRCDPGCRRRLRTSRRRGQQRRLRERQLDRGLRRGGLPSADRDEPVGRHQRHARGAARPARAGRRPRHPDLLAGRAHHLAGSRPVPDLEVGGRGLLGRAAEGGRAAGHPRHDRRARRVPHRLGRIVDDREAVVAR
jgi:hypothetical protein